MAKNKTCGDNARKGAVKGRSQMLNPKNNRFVKIDSKTKKFMDNKAKANSPFKGVRKLKRR